MMLIFLAMSFIAATVCSTATPPSLACLAACTAMPSVTLAFSPFCVIEAVICSTDALVSSTLAACSLEAWFIDCEVALTSSEADDSDSALERTSPTTCASLAVMSRMDANNWPTSSFEVLSMRTVRSPCVMRSVTLTACESGTVIERVIHMAIAPPISRDTASREYITFSANAVADCASFMRDSLVSSWTLRKTSTASIDCRCILRSSP